MYQKSISLALLLSETMYITRISKQRNMTWAGHIARMGETEGKRPLGRPRFQWNVRIYLKVKEWKVSTCSSNSEQKSVTGPNEHHNKLSGSSNFWEILE
jgi:hypothetical protein